MSVPGFLFGGSTGLTPEQLKKRREVFEAMRLRNMTSAPRNVGEGLTAVGQAIAYRMGMNDIAKGEAEARDRRDSIMAPIFGASNGASYVDPNANAGVPATSGLASTTPDVGNWTGNDIYSGFIDTVKDGGLTNPYGLSAVAATGRAESGFSPQNANRSWSDPSESGQAGMAGGIMSWRGPRLQALYDYASSKGERPGSISPQTQAEFFMREDPQLVGKLNNARSIEEAQALMNGAWKFAGYNRPGGEAARRLSYASSFLPEFQGAGTEVASLDPGVGMPPAAAAINQQAPGSGYVDPMVSAPNYRPDTPSQGAQANMLPPLPAGRDVGPAPGMNAPHPQQMAQQPGGMMPVLMGGQQVAQGDFPPAPQPQSGPSLQQLYQIATSPDISDQDRAIVGSMIEQKMREQQRQSDPAYRMQMEKARLDIEAARNGQWSKLDDGRLYNQRTGEVRDAPLNPNAPSADLGLNPQYGVDANGNPVILQLGKNGQVVQSKMPEGVTLSKEPIKLDAGTHFVLLDPITRQPVGQVPKDLAGAERDKNAGKALAESQAALPQIEDSANAIISSIDSLKDDPYLDSMLGSVQGRWLPNVSSDAARVQSKMDQIGGQTFMQAYNNLRGSGQITEEEGRRATDAMARLNTAQSEADYRAALDELRGVVTRAVETARRNAGMGGQVQPAADPGVVPTDIPGVTIRRKQ